MTRLCCSIWSWDLAINVSIESFLHEWLVSSSLFEADKITKADTQNKSVADALAIDQSNERENVADVLQMRLNNYNLEMEETALGKKVSLHEHTKYH